MHETLKLIFNQTQGEWISHQTFYYLNEKKFKVNKQNIEIKTLKPITNFNDYDNNHSYQYNTTDNKKIICTYLYNNNYNSNSGIIQKSYDKKTIKYKFKLNYNKCLKIMHSIRDIIHYEYIYYINKNLRISIAVTKKKNQYITVCFTSEIKIKQ